jgi:hypothetical protein
VQATPDATLAEHCTAWEQTPGVRVSLTSMDHALARLGWPRTKTVYASEQDPVVRAAWREQAVLLDPTGRVSFDDTSSVTNLTRRYAARPARPVP